MDQEHFHHKKKVFLLLAIVLSVFLIILSISGIVDISNKIKQGRYIGQESEFKNSIVVSETGEIYAKPDLGVISFSVVKEAKTVSDAMNSNTEVMNNVIQAMKDQGVEDKDLKTTNFSIYPRYEYTEGTFGKRVLVGYEVFQQLQVKIRQMDKIGTIIEQASSAGINNMGQLQFTIDDEEELKKQARAQAVEKAKTKALELASQLDVKLGKVISFNESFFMPYYDTRVFMEQVGVGGGTTPDIEAGENKITVSVTVTYEIY
jgi:uncharacterized protein YggE